MIKLTEDQFRRICPKTSRLAQCEWFRSIYGCTLEIKHTTRYKCSYYLNFKSAKEETFFRLKYSDIFSFQPDPTDVLSKLLHEWTLSP